jgi:hypothetical protein
MGECPGARADAWLAMSSRTRRLTTTRVKSGKRQRVEVFKANRECRFFSLKTLQRMQESSAS